MKTDINSAHSFTEGSDSGTINFADQKPVEETKVSHTPTDKDIENWVNANEISSGDHLAIDSFRVRDFILPIRDKVLYLTEEVKLLQAANDGLRTNVNLYAFRERHYPETEKERTRLAERLNASSKAYADLLKENQELKARCQIHANMVGELAGKLDRKESLNAELLALLESAKTVIEILSTDNDTLLMKQIESAINKAKAQ